jgi:hypothetical protein
MKPLLSMAGIVKDFLERTYYPCEGKLEGRPYALIVCAGTDGTGAVRDVEKVASGLRLRQIAPPLIYKSGFRRVTRPVAEASMRSRTRSKPSGPP